MKPIKIINVTICNTKTDPNAGRNRRAYLWECDNGSFYLTKEMARIIGTMPEALVYKYKRHGLCDKLIVPSKGYKGIDASEVEPFAFIDAMNLKLTCRPGDVVMCEGKKVSVNKIMELGKENMKKAGIFYSGNRSLISAYRITPDNGQVLKRSSFYVGDNWSHI